MRNKVFIKTIEPHARIVCEYLLFKPPQIIDTVGTSYFQELDISILQWMHGNLMNLYYDAYHNYVSSRGDIRTSSQNHRGLLHWSYRIPREEIFSPSLSEGFYNMGFNFKEIIGHGSSNTYTGMQCAARGFRLEVVPVLNNDTYDYFGMYEIRFFIDFRDSVITVVNKNDPITAEQRFAINREHEYRMIEMAHQEQELKAKQKAEYFSKADVIEVKKFKKVYVNLNKIWE